MTGVKALLAPGAINAMVLLGLLFWVLGERKRKTGLTGIVVSVETDIGTERP
ncbi:MAG TPA: hypothetical protein VFB06_22170 [Streptosporangiaceae bacterium]|nr:hypothetical protein [Streptosporangiaceae bacterium]